MRASSIVAIALAATACGGAKKPPIAPVAEHGFELAEMTVRGADGKAWLKIHANGGLELKGLDDVFTGGQTLRPDGVLVGYRPMARLDGDKLVLIEAQLTTPITLTVDRAVVRLDRKTVELDIAPDGEMRSNGVPSGRVDGARTPGQRRTALYVIVLFASLANPPRPDARMPAAECAARGEGFGGRVTSKSEPEPLAGVTVTAASPAFGSQVQTAITDDDGCYFIEVPPGDYTVTYFYLDLSPSTRVTVTAGAPTSANMQIDVKQ